MRIVDDIDDEPVAAAPVGARIVDDIDDEPDIAQRVGQVAAGLTLPPPGVLQRMFGGADPTSSGPLQDVAQALPRRAAQFVAENPRQAAGMAAAMAPGIVAGALVPGLGPAALLAQGAAGILGEGARQAITGEELDPRLLLSSGALQALPITGGPGAVAAKSGLVNMADAEARARIQRGEGASTEELAGAALTGGLVGGGLSLALGGNAARGAGAEAGAPPPRIVDDIDEFESFGGGPREGSRVVFPSREGGGGGQDMPPGTLPLQGGEPPQGPQAPGAPPGSQAPGGAPAAPVRITVDPSGQRGVTIEGDPDAAAQAARQLAGGGSAQTPSPPASDVQPRNYAYNALRSEFDSRGGPYAFDRQRADEFERGVDRMAAGEDKRAIVDDIAQRGNDARLPTRDPQVLGAQIASSQPGFTRTSRDAQAEIIREVNDALAAGADKAAIERYTQEAIAAQLGVSPAARESRQLADELRGGPPGQPRSPMDMPILRDRIERLKFEPVGRLVTELDDTANAARAKGDAEVARVADDARRLINGLEYAAAGAGRRVGSVRELTELAREVYDGLDSAPLRIVPDGGSGRGREQALSRAMSQVGQTAVFHVVRADRASDITLVRVGAKRAASQRVNEEVDRYQRGRKVPDGAVVFNIGGMYGLGSANVGRAVLERVGRAVADRLGVREVYFYSTSRVTGARGAGRVVVTAAGGQFVPPFRVLSTAAHEARRAARRPVEPPAAAVEAPDPYSVGAPVPKPEGLFDRMRAASSPEPEPAPAPAPTGGTTEARVFRLPRTEINVDPQRFQTRATFGSGGASGQLRDVRTWDDSSAGNVAVWRDPEDGRWYAVDGHNRMDLAERANQPDVRVMEIVAATAGEARARGALINMRSGNFNEIDVATYLRETGLRAPDLEAQGISLSMARNRDGAALADLHPALFAMVARGEMSIRRGAMLARILGPGRDAGYSTAEAHAQQLSVAQMVAQREQSGRTMRDADVEELARASSMAETTTGTQDSLFGPEQVTRSNAVERAEVVSEIRRRLRADSRLFSTVGRQRSAARLAQEGNQIDVDRARVVATDAAQIDELLSRLAYRSGPVAELVNDAARRIAQGEPAARVIADAEGPIREELARANPSRGPGDTPTGGSTGQGGLFGNQRGSVEGPESLARGVRRLVDLFRRRLGPGDRAGAAGTGGRDLGGGNTGRRAAGAEGDWPGPGGAGSGRRPRGSLASRLSTARQPAGTEGPPRGDSGVLLYGPDDRPLRLTGRLSAHDPDLLAPTHRLSLDDRLADMNQRLAELQRGRIGYARRNVVSNRQTYREADDLRAAVEAYEQRNGLRPGQALSMLRRRGEGANAATIEYLNTLQVEAAVTARAAAARSLVDPSPENRQAAREAVALLLETQPQRAGALAEVGRALQIAGQPRGANANLLRALRALEDSAGGASRVDELIDHLAMFDPNDVLAINQFVRRAATATWRDKAYELWINSLLSGPITQAKNALSNALNQPIRIGERIIAASVDPVRVALQGGRRERFLGEATADLVGVVSGLGDATRAGLRAFLTEIPREGGTKFLDPGSRAQAIKGRTGRLVRLPSRTLLGFDEFFKALTTHGELHAIAYRRASQEGLFGRARKQRMMEYLAEPDHDMVEQAATAARYWAFQQKMGEAGQLGVRWRNKVPGAGVIMPFVQTPVNVAKFGLERTPLSLGYIAHKVARGELRGGALSDQVARSAVGMAIAGSIATAYSYGLITGGGPRDPSKRQSWLLDNKPYSVQVGDKWVSYGSVEPLGITVGLVADAMQVWELVDQEAAASAIATSIATSLGFNLGNKTFLRGISDMMNAYSDPERYGERWIQSLTGTLVPTGVAQIARAADPTFRKPQTTLYNEDEQGNLSLGDVFKNRLPGMRDDVIPVRDVWGEPLREQGLFDGSGAFVEFVERALSPVDVSRTKPDRASREVARLGATPDAPSHSLELHRERIELTPEQWDGYVRDSGRLAKRYVDKLVDSASYQRWDDETRAEAIHRTFIAARAEVRGRLKSDIAKGLAAASRD